MSTKEKRLLAYGGAALVLYLLYRWYHNSSMNAAQTAGTQTGATDPAAAASDYAALAGQEQSDVAALQGQNSQLLAQEQSDVQSLSGQEGADVASLSAGILGAGQAALAAITPAFETVTQQVAKVAAGETAISRATTITTHSGGKFYDYYKDVVGKAPAAVMSNTDPLYLAWKKGTPVKTAKKEKLR